MATTQSILFSWTNVEALPDLYRMENTEIVAQKWQKTPEEPNSAIPSRRLKVESPETWEYSYSYRSLISPLGESTYRRDCACVEHAF